MILNFKFCNEKVDVDFLRGHNSTEKNGLKVYMTANFSPNLFFKAKCNWCANFNFYDLNFNAAIHSVMPLSDLVCRL